MRYVKSIIMLLSLLAFSKSMTIENGDSKLQIGGFMDIYMNSGSAFGDIGDTYTAKDMVSQLNFGFSHKESEELKSIGYISIGMDTTAEYGSSEMFLERYKTFIGLEHSSLGSIYIGTMTSVNYTILGWTDQGLPHSGSGHSIWDKGDEGVERGIGYAEDAIFYTKNFKFNDTQSLDFYIETQAAEASYHHDDDHGLGDGFRRQSASAAGLVYNIGKFSIGLTDSMATFEQEGTLNSVNGYEMGLGLRYKGEQLYLAFTASKQENVSSLNTDNVGIEFAADYKFKSGYGILTIYNLRQITGGSAAESEGIDGYNDVNYITLTGYKVLSNQFKLYIEAQIDLRTSDERKTFITDSNAGDNDSSISVGMQYDF